MQTNKKTKVMGLVIQYVVNVKDALNYANMKHVLLKLLTY